MKNLNFKLINILFISVVTLSCNKENEVANTKKDNFTADSSKNISVDDINLSEINKEAFDYYSNLKTAILATGSNKKNSLRSSEDEENPLIEKLEEIEIIKEENGEQISFFDMPENSQIDFLEDWSLLQAEEMSRKLIENPELEEYLKEQNEIVGDVLEEETTTLKSTEISLVKDNKVFFEKIKSRLETKNSEIQPELRSTISSEDKISSDIVKNSLIANARRGDFLLVLPKHGQPWAFANLSNDNFKVGHAGILTSTVYSYTNFQQGISLGAWTSGGVKDESINTWSVRCYLMGIQKVSWKWQWRGFKSKFVKTSTPVSNPGALADWANKYKGREYVYWYEFLTAKWAAPSRFTCTTLVWYCANKAYDINISDWWATMVSPSGVYLDESTYVRKEIK